MEEDMSHKNEKLVQINTVFYASTGRIMADIQKYAQEHGYDTISFVGRGPASSEIKGKVFGNPFSFWSHVIITTLFDAQGYGSYFATKKLIRWIKAENPDIIHLHNLHGYYLHIPLFCRYLKEEYKGRVYWTFHDCWPVTGHCAYFISANCDKWKMECQKCPKKTEYPISFLLDGSKRNFRMKQKWFAAIPNLTIMTPSEWIRDIVKDSFLNTKRVEVVHNGIDLSVFHPQNDEAIWEKYHVPSGNRVLLGVANIWNARKGLDDFGALAEVLPDEYHIVLVGLTKRQIRKLPDHITGIERTDNLEELVKIYSGADVFINPSLEESFSLVTVEAMACGTPVIVLNTSAVKELVDDRCGLVLSEHRPQDYISAIRELSNRNLSGADVRACAEKYSIVNMTKEVLEAYSKCET